MAKHGIIVFVSPAQKDNPDAVPEPGPPAWDEAIRERVSDHVDNHFNSFDTVKNFEPTEIQGAGGNKYIKMNKRYSENSGTKTEVLDRVEKKVTKDAEWYKIMYHECLEPDVCTNGYSVEREGGTIPDWL